MIAYTNHRKTSSAKRNSSWMPKLSEKDRRKWRRLCLKITKLQQQRWQQNSLFSLKTVSTKTVWWELHKSNVPGTAAIAKPLDTENNVKGKKDGVTIIKPGCLMIGICSIVGQMSYPSHSSQH
jgi:hypothetical protein